MPPSLAETAPPVSQQSTTTSNRVLVNDENTVNQSMSAAVKQKDDTACMPPPDATTAHLMDEISTSVRAGDSNVNKKRKFKVFSGQTDAERRKIRQMQRALNDQFAQADSDLPTLKVAHNTLFEQVRFHREAVLDAYNQQSYTRQYQRRIEADFAQSARSFSADDIVQSLMQKCVTNSGTLDWVTLGREGGICLHRVPARVSFMQGAFGPPKERKVAQRQPRTNNNSNIANAKEAKPREMDAKDKEAGKNSLSAMEKLISVTKKVIAKNAVETGGTKLDALDLMWHPRSFTQTIENMFTASFHVKAGCMSMKWKPKDGANKDNNDGDNTSSPWQLEWKEEDDEVDAPNSRRSAIVSLTLKDFQRLSAARNDKNCLMPNREGYPGETV